MKNDVKPKLKTETKQEICEWLIHQLKDTGRLQRLFFQAEEVSKYSYDGVVDGNVKDAFEWIIDRTLSGDETQMTSALRILLYEIQNELGSVAVQVLGENYN